MGDTTKQKIQVEVPALDNNTAQRLRQLIIDANINGLNTKQSSLLTAERKPTQRVLDNEVSASTQLELADIYNDTKSAQISSHHLEAQTDKKDISTQTYDAKEKTSGILDNAKNFVVDENNKPKWMNIGIVAVGVTAAHKAVSWVKSWFGGDKPKEGGNNQGEDKLWYKSTWLWTGVAVAGGWFARDNKDKISNAPGIEDKIRETAIAKVIDSAPESTKEFLRKVCEKHKDELAKCDIMDIPKNIMEFAAADAVAIPGQKIDELNQYIVGLLPNWGKDFLGKNHEEAKKLTEEQSNQQVAQTAGQTDRSIEAVKKKVVAFDQKIFEQHLSVLNKQRSDNITDFEKNKANIATIYTEYLSWLNMINMQKSNNGSLAFPNLTKNTAIKLLEMTKYMKEKKEYMSVANGIRTILMVGDIKTEAMPSAESVLEDMNDRQKLAKSLKSAPDVDSWTSTIYNGEEYKQKYSTAINKRKDKLKIDVENISDDKIKNPITGLLISDTKELANDMFGIGTFHIGDEFYDRYFGVAAGLGGGIIGMVAGTALNFTGIGVVGGVPLQIASAAAISGAVAVLSTKAIMMSGGQEYDIFSKQGGGDFLLNAIPGGAIAKIGKSASVVARIGKYGAKGLEAAVYGGSGIAISKMQTGEYNVGPNLAFAMIPLVGNKLLAGRNIKIPESIRSFNEYISNKYNNSSNAIIQTIRKEQLISILRGQTGISPNTLESIKKVLTTNGNNIREDIISFANKLPQTEQDELKQFLIASGVNDINISIINSAKQASKNNALNKIPSLNKLNKNIASWSDDEINAFNNYIAANKSRGLVNRKGERYYIKIENRKIVFTDTRNGNVLIQEGGTEYVNIMKSYESSTSKEIINNMFNWIKNETSFQNITVEKFLIQNGYSKSSIANILTTRYTKDWVNMRFSDFISHYGLDFQNCLSRGDYAAKLGTGLRNLTTNPLGMTLIGRQIGDNTVESGIYAGSNLLMARKAKWFRLLANSVMIFADSKIDLGD